ncbi:MAG: HTH-type transcriptional regulator Ptr2 [Candidatus Bathyarchaeota archaeon BA2]|nr:MAG: HTH-type transcriptional regulator Ptr2 [Candidatus Bathyarchaeota archaeon BA2]
MKEKMKRLLFELIKNSKNSDRNIANILGVSQPTITRMRKKLEEKAIVEYTVTPDLTELGYELMAVTFVSIRGSVKSEEKQKNLEKWMMEQPNIVFACDGTGMGMDGMIISIHKDYTDFSGLVTKLRTEWSGALGEIKTFVSSIKGGVILKPYSLKYLEKVT